MGDDSDTTIKIRLNSKIGTDSQGRAVWTKPIEPVELELVSTAMLEQLLESGDESQTARMRALAEGHDGVLARNPSSHEYEVVSDAEFEAALQAASLDAPADAQPPARPKPTIETGTGEALSLVTTQVLRKILAGEEIDDSDDSNDPAEPAKKGGYNPYDRG